MHSNRVIVIGLGRLGSKIATMSSANGDDVVVIDKSSDSFRKLDETYSGYQMVGDVTDIDVLHSLHLNQATRVVITTDSDNVNIMIAQICLTMFNVPNIYVRLNDVAKSKLIEHTRICAIYPFLLSIREYERLLTAEGGNTP
jgi:trk system potassium uptake protein TrkA